MIDHVRLTPEERQKLINIKRDTGISNWNVLCRWAFALSMAQKGVPPSLSSVPRGAVEMTWDTFAGADAAIFEALLEVDQANAEFEGPLSEWLYRHLNRGINILSGKLKESREQAGRTGIEHMVKLV